MSLGYKRFNRHQVFQPGDNSLVLNMIGDLNGLHSIKNMLYGLFDGYWYDDLLYRLYTETNISGEDINKLETILERVEDNLVTVLTHE